MNKICIGVIFGGVSGEHEVSLMSARSILNALSEEKYEVVQIGITHDGQWVSGQNVLEGLETNQIEGLTRVFMFPFSNGGRLFSINGSSFAEFQKLDVVFPILHGTFGEDGNLQGYLEIGDMAFVGADVASSAVCMEKNLFKDIMQANGLPIVEMLVFTRDRLMKQPDEVIREVESRFPYPVFVKPVNLGSSVGVHKCFQRDELQSGLFDAAKYSRRIGVETGIEAREIEVAVLGNENRFEVSFPGEIRYSDEFYSYHAKYFDKDTALIIPAPMPSVLAEEIRRLAGRVWQVVGCSGMARVDFLVEKSTEKIYINEVNTIPGFTHASMYPRLWQHSGMSYSDLVDRLIELALERFKEKKKTLFRYEED